MENHFEAIDNLEEPEPLPFNPQQEVMKHLAQNVIDGYMTIKEAQQVLEEWQAKWIAQN